MRLEIKFKESSKLEPFVMEIPEVACWVTPIIELQIETKKGKSRERAMTDYLVNISYLFKDILNEHESDIEAISITNSIVGDMNKNGTELHREDATQGISKYDIITYMLYSNSFKEQLYITKDVDEYGNEGTFKYKDMHLNMSITDRQDKDITRVLTSLVPIMLRFFPNYTLEVDKKTRKLYYTYKGSKLNKLEDIKEDNVYTFLKLVDVVMQRGEHTGLYFIDCKMIDPKALEGILTFINLYYQSNRVIFLYNAEQNTAVTRGIDKHVIVLPNQKLPIQA